MDPVFDAQYVPVRNRSFERGTQMEVAYSPDGWVDYIYVVDQLLARPDDTEQLRRMLPGLRHVERDELHGLGDRQLPDGLAVLSIDRLEQGRFTVPEILDRLEATSAMTTWRCTMVSRWPHRSTSCTPRSSVRPRSRGCRLALQPSHRRQ